MKCVFSGSFDPLTNGHLDVIKRVSVMFDEVIVAVATNAGKSSKAADLRVALAKKCTESIGNVKVMKCDGLLADFCKQNGAHCIVRGIRSVKDFEYERDMAFINRDLCGIETVFLSAENALSYVSSGYVRELAALGRSVEAYVPLAIADDVKSVYGPTEGKNV